MKFKAVLVDDERPSLRITKKILEETGSIQVVHEFTNPFEALTYLAQETPDIVFLDVEMPIQDGITTAQKLLEMHPHLPIVFITAFTDYAVEAFKLNAVDYLVKPIEVERVLESLKRIHVASEHSPVINSDLTVQTFGTFSVRAEGHDIHFRTRKAEEVLCYLIDSQGEYVSREHLADLFWGDFRGDNAIFNLNTTLYYIKKALSEYSARPLIESDRGRYRFCIEQVDCDFIEFESFSTRKEETAGEHLDHLVSAISLYKGEYLATNEYQWSRQRAIRFETIYIRMVKKAVQLMQDRVSEIELQNLLWEALTHVKADEELTYVLLVSLIRTGNLEQAQKLFEDYSVTCRDLFDHTPDQRFHDLFSS